MSQKLGNNKAGPTWHDLLGAHNWDGLLDPLNEDLRSLIIRCGDFCQVTYDTFINDPNSAYCGCSRYSKADLLHKTAFTGGSNHYDVVAYLYATARVSVPEALLLKSRSRERWDRESNWIGYIAVTNDEVSEEMGRREIYVAWRGTTRDYEWINVLGAKHQSAKPLLRMPDSGVQHMLCSRHITENVQNHIKFQPGTNKDKKLGITRAIGNHWKRLTQLVTEEDFISNLEALRTKWSKHYSYLFDYACSEWLNKYKDCFVVAWTKNYLHFGSNTTNRVESSHSQIKGMLGNMGMGFKQILRRVDDAVLIQLREIKTKMEASNSKHQDKMKRSHFFKNIINGVIKVALDMLWEEYHNVRALMQPNCEVTCSCIM